MTTKTWITIASLWLVGAAEMAAAEDWPMWGRTPERNMVSPETGIADSFDPGRMKDNSEEVDLSTTKNVKWVVKLGSQAYGNPTVANGRVFIGTNNETPRDPRHKGDRGVVFCLDEQTGRFLWQLVVPKLGAGKVSDWEYLGICSSPAVDGDRVYVVTNRCEVVCLDVHGMANGNQGPFKDEGKYMVGLESNKPPMEVGPTDADILWRFDMRDELGVFPHNITSSSPLVVGDTVYATTSNGQDWSHVNIPSPKAPTLIALNKHTGELIGEEGSGISTRLMHSNWSSPAFVKTNKGGVLVFGAGDGFCYGFDPKAVPDEDGFRVFKELWRYDCNPRSYRFEEDGTPRRYATYDGPSEVIATPVVYKGRVYVTTGQDPEHGEGVGRLSCIDPTRRGDISKTGAVWTYRAIERSISTPAIAEGLIYEADYTGRLHCLDANTGEVKWVHDTQSHIWGSPLVVDGKVYLANEDGELLVLKAGPVKKVLHVIDMGAPVYSSPIVANGVLYIATQTHLYAVKGR